MNGGVAIYAGSFDPITFGHLEIIERSKKLFDKLIVAVGNNPTKKTLFTVKERLDMIRNSTNGVEGESYDCLLADYVRRKGAKVLVRGLRSSMDFDYEFQMCMAIKKLAPEIEVVFLFSGQNELHLSSSMVREVAMFGGDVRPFVPPYVAEKLTAKVAKIKSAATFE